MIIIFNSRLQGHTLLAHQLENLSQEVAQIGNACAYVPKTGRTEEMVSLLQRHQIKFGIHLNNDPVKKQMEEK